MKFSARVITTAAAFALTCVVSAAALYYKNRINEFNEVMVFCKLQYNVYNYFDKLMGFIENSKRCVNVCMPGVHNPAIQGRLVHLIKKKNVKIRIVIDRTGYNDTTEVFIKELIEAGADIRYKKGEPGFSMQHKFCLVDDRILLTGTLNWGNDRSFDHWNYVFITNKDELVCPVKQEFYNIWDKSSDIQSMCDYSDISETSSNTSVGYTTEDITITVPTDDMLENDKSTTLDNETTNEIQNEITTNAKGKKDL